jgi:hypothetical protein
MVIKMKTQTELAEEMANEFAACGSEDITVFAILDVLASTGISLIEKSLSSPVQELYALYETI